jgi:hypothetical protein
MDGIVVCIASLTWPEFNLAVSWALKNVQALQLPINWTYLWL